MFGWLGSLWDTGGDILGAAKRWLFGVIVMALGVVENALNGLLSALGNLANLLGDLAVGLAHAIESGLQTVSDFAIRLYNDAINWASSAIDWTIKHAEALANELGNALKWAVDQIWSGIQDVYHWADSNILQPLWNIAQAAWNFATVTLPQTVARWIGDLQQWAMDGINWIWSALSPLWNFFSKVLIDGWKVIEQAWDWITWFAVHPISMGLGLLNDITKSSPGDLFGRVQNTIDTMGDHVFSMFAHFLEF